MMARAPYEYITGTGKARVVVYEDVKRHGTLYLRWRDRAKGNWKRQSLGRAVETDGRGRITADCEAFAIGAAQQKSLRLASGIADVAPEERKPTTIGDAEALITNPDTGKYPHETPFRAELVRALRLAAALWGEDTTWAAIEESHWTLLLRRRLETLVAKNAKGVRATEITISRLITAVRWLRRMKHIPREAAPWPDEWKLEVTRHWKGITHSDRDPQPDRPRYTLDEARRIIAAADFDPRLDLLVRLSIGLRPGQAARARRTDLVLPVVDWTQPIAAEGDDIDYGTFTVYGAGKKGGVIVDLTRGQRLAVEHALTGEGYLADIERRLRVGETKDYALFPSGYVVGRVALMRGRESKLSLAEGVDFSRPITGGWIRKNWRVAEKRAEIVHEHGRATYGFRRLAVDVADELGLSPAGLQATGGWVDSKIPSAIYRERGNKAGRREARAVRSTFLEDIEK